MECVCMYVCMCSYYFYFLSASLLGVLGVYVLDTKTLGARCNYRIRV
jgi:hypothetical protein